MANNTSRPAITLLPKNIFVRERGSEQNLIASSYGEGRNLLDDIAIIFDTYASSEDKFVDGYRSMFVRDCNRINRQVLELVVETGSSGNAGRVVTEDNVLKTEINRTDTTLHKYMVQIWLRENVDRAFMISACISNVGAHTLVSRCLTSDFSNIVGRTHKLSVEHVLPSDVFDQFMKNASLRELSFWKYGTPGLLETMVAKGGSEPTKVHAVLSIIDPEKSLPRKLIKPIMDYLRGGKTIKELYSIPGFAHDDIVASMHDGFRARSVRLSKLDRFTWSEDITSEVPLDENLEPNLDAIRRQCEYLADQYYPQPKEDKA